MAAPSTHTDEQKKAFVALAQEKGRKPAAKKAGVTVETITVWAKQQGVSIAKGKRQKAPKKRRLRNASVRVLKDNYGTNGHANGKAVYAAPTATSFPELTNVERQLTEALESVRTMRAAFRQVFG